jgi:hypothetical protein
VTGYNYLALHGLIVLSSYFVAVSPPPKGRKTENLVNGSSDVFSTDPFFTASDPFGMSDFSNNKQQAANDSNKMNGFSENGFNAFTPSNNMTIVNANNMTNNGSNYNINLNGFTNGLNEMSLNNMTFTSQNNLTNNLKAQPQQIDTALQFLDKKIEEMKLGFSRGILNDDFPLDSLDPLKNKSS